MKYAEKARTKIFKMWVGVSSILVLLLCVYTLLLLLIADLLWSATYKERHKPLEA